mgnify:CR=1 FL=1
MKIDTVINSRIKSGEILSTKIQELKGVSFEQFMVRLPVDLDFLTANEMFEELNK